MKNTISYKEWSFYTEEGYYVGNLRLNAATADEAVAKTKDLAEKVRAGEIPRLGIDWMLEPHFAIEDNRIPA